jgi:PAS domain S-box-containing protein
MFNEGKLGSFLYQAFLESPIPTIVADQHSFKLANESFCNHFHYLKSEIPLLDFDNLAPKNIIEISHFEIISKGDSLLKHQISERYMVKKTGEVVLVELSLIPHEFEGQLLAVIFIRDISKYKTKNEKLYESEKRLKLALKSSNQAIWDWNCITDETFYSDDYFIMLGYEPNEFEPSYKNWVSLLHPEDREITTFTQNLFTQNKLDKYEIDFRLRKKDGSYIWTHTRAIILSRVGADAVAERMIGIVINIDEQKEKQEIINEQTQRLIEFAFYNSHILRAPISRILGIIEEIKYEHQIEYIDALEKSTLEIEAVTREMNSLLQSGNTKVRSSIRNIKSVTFLTKNAISQAIYTKLAERYSASFDIFFNSSLPDFLSTSSVSSLKDQIVIIDIEEQDDTFWDMVQKLETQYKDLNIFLLVAIIKVEEIYKAKNLKQIKGIFLKPLTMEKIKKLFWS